MRRKLAAAAALALGALTLAAPASAYHYDDQGGYCPPWPNPFCSYKP